MSVAELDDLLDHIRKAATEACGFVEGMSREALLADKRTQHAVTMCPRLGIQVNKTHDDMRDRGRLMCNLTSLGQSCGDFSPMRGFLLGHTVLARLAKGVSNFRFQPGRGIARKSTAIC